MELVNETNKSGAPFEPLGRQIKRWRIKRQQSLAEVSGAIEIDPESLAVIECGQERPQEDVLALLISYFNIKEDEADDLWKLAGYEEEINKSSAMILPEDLRVVYTDVASVTINNYGVVMNFMQTVGPGNQPLAIARVGMSKEHALNVLDMLDRALKQTPKQLPIPKPPVDPKK